MAIPYALPETRWSPGALTANTPVQRTVRDAYTGAYPHDDAWSQVRINNTESPANLTVLVNGQTRDCPAGGVITLYASDLGPISAYQITPDVNVASGKTVAYEEWQGPPKRG